jgi:triosephosphate isomerase (TIM)
MYMTRPHALELIRGLRERLQGKARSVQVVVAPPFTALGAVADAISGSGWHLAGQNGHFEKEGAFTGEVSFPMLRDVGCEFVILGHSERRQIFGETDQFVNKKVHASISCQLTPILCVGETLEEREQGDTIGVVQRQLSEGLSGMAESDTPDLVVAYEPVWAIGTGRTATPQQAQEVHAMIRQFLQDRFSPARAQRTRVLYGGSVKAENVDDLMAQPDIDGALVGGASLKADSFARIVDFRAVSNGH